MALAMQYVVIAMLVLASAVFVVKHSAPKAWAAGRLRLAAWLHQASMPAFARRVARRMVDQESRGNGSCGGCSGCD